MTHNLSDLAELVGGRLFGDGRVEIIGAATIRDARPGEITLADKPSLIEALADSDATAAVVSPQLAPDNIPYIVVDDVHTSFARIVAHFRPQRMKPPIGVSPAAHVSPGAEIGSDVAVYPGAVIDEGVTIGDGCVIFPGVHLMTGCRLGTAVTVFSNVVLYENTIVGDRSIIHAGAIIGAYGFGYEQVDGKHQLSAQLGNVEIGSDVEIGACTTIDRGTYGPTIVGDGTKIDNQVMIGHNCRIGRNNLLCSQVGIAGSCTTGDYVVMAGQVGIGDHVDIGDSATLAAQTGVMHNVPAHARMLGTPAIPSRDQMVRFASIGKLPEMRHQLRDLQRVVNQIVGQAEPPQQQDAA